MKRTKEMLAALAAGCVLTMGLTAYAEEAETLKVAYIPNSMSNEMNAYGYKIMEENQDDYNMEVTAFDGKYDAQTETSAITNCIGQG